MKETEIEVFRVGPSSRGITADNIAEVASFDCSASPLGICFGHPKSDTPAAGTISKLRAAGNSLFATVSSLTTAAVDGIKDGSWLTPSFAFFDPTHESNPRPGKWSPRHLGLLGAAAPGIPGLGKLEKTLAFNADADVLEATGDPGPAVVYSGRPTPIHFVAEERPHVADQLTPEQQAEAQRLATERSAFEAERTAFAAERTRARESGNGALVDNLVTVGKVLPAEAAGLKVVFNALDGGEHEFGAADKSDKATPAARLAAFLATAIAQLRVPIGDRKSPSAEFTANGDLDAAGLTARAEALMKERPGLTFEAAINAVSTGQ